jgi:hypothetical protein
MCMFNLRKSIPLLLLLITTAALAGVLILGMQSSSTGKTKIPETSTFEWIGKPSGHYLCI